MHSKSLAVTLMSVLGWCLPILSQAPEIAFRAEPAVAFPDQSIMLTAEIPNNTAYELSWDLGNNQTRTGSMVEIQYGEPGAYKVTLRATLGNVETVFSRWVFINDPLASADPNKNPPFKFINTPIQGQAIEVNIPFCFGGQGLDQEGDAVTLYWDFDDGTVAEGMNTVMKTYSHPGQYNPKLWAVDSTGLAETYPSFAAIVVYDQVQPPDAKIIKPVANRRAFNNPVHELKLGEALCLQGRIDTYAEGELPSGYSAYWQAYGSGDPLRFDGIQPDPVVLPADYYYLYFHVLDPQGIADPIVDEVQVWIRDDNRPPEEVTILEPNYDVTLTPGEGLDLSGRAVDLDGDALSYEWQISDGRRFAGTQINHVVFSQPGLFQVTLIAKDTQGGEAQPKVSRYVMVQGGTDACAELPPAPFARRPEQTRISGPPGTRLNFQAQWEVLGPEVEDVFWDFSRGLNAEGPESGPITFTESGWHPVRVFLKNTCGNWRVDEVWSVYIYGDNIPPQSAITQPQTNALSASNKPVFATPVGQTVSFSAEYEDPDGHYPLFQRWELTELNSQTNRYETRTWSIDSQPEALRFDTTGLKTVSLFVFDNRGVQEVFPQALNIQVIDPNLKPESQIVLPDGPITVEPGVPLNFQGYGEDPNGLAVSYDWDFGPQAQPSTATGAWVSGVVFAQPSPEGQPYVVKLKAKTPFAQEETAATVLVRVKQFNDRDFEPNNSVAQATLIQQGVYRQLELADGDRADVYRFEVNDQGRDLYLNLQGDQSALEMKLFRWINEQWVIFPLDFGVERTGLVTVQDLPKGLYALSLERQVLAKRRNVAYGLSLATVQPSQYVPFMVLDESLRSYLGILNPTGDAAFVQGIGLDERGRVVAEIGFRLNAGERRYQSAASWFGFQQDDPRALAIKWVRLSSERRLISYMVTESLDQTQLMSAGGITTLTDQIMIPHIANPENGWYTRAVVVNGQGQTDALGFKAPSIEVPIAESALANSQQDFRFQDRLQGSVPQWGQFLNQTQAAALAGIEVFGRTDSKRQMSAIEMLDVRRNNPNFTYVGNELYFTHIAADLANWWTGISLINIDSEPASYQIIGYDRNGVERVRLENQILPPGGKLLKTSQAIFGDKKVDWMKVVGDGRLAGFELFGDPELNRAAGFKAASFITDTLFFPHIATEFPFWTGISLVNVTNVPLSVTIEAYANDGRLLASEVQSLPPFAKKLEIAQTIISSGLPAGTGYLKVTADRRALSGFQLFGTLNSAGAPGDQLAGLAAIPF